MHDASIYEDSIHAEPSVVDFICGWVMVVRTRAVDKVFSHSQSRTVGGFLELSDLVESGPGTSCFSRAPRRLPA